MRLAAVAIAVAMLAVAGCGDPRTVHPAVGAPMRSLPIVSVADPAAGPPALEGRVSLVNLWGTWCPPCRRELPGLARLADRLAAEPAFQLVAISCNPGVADPAELSAETRAFLAARKLDLDAWVFSDPFAARLFADAHGLEAFPTTYLVDPATTVRRVWVGYRSRDEAEIAAAVVAVLKELPGGPPERSPAGLQAAPAARAAR